MRILNIFRSKKRLREIAQAKIIQQEILLIKKVQHDLNKWDDIPLSMQYRSRCETLKLPYCDGAILFVDECIISRDYEKLAEELIRLREIINSAYKRKAVGAL